MIMDHILEALRESRRSHDKIKVSYQGLEIPYDHSYMDGVVREKLIRTDKEGHNLPNTHYSNLDINGVWYIYDPNGSVVQTLDKDKFDAGDVASILPRLDNLTEDSNLRLPNPIRMNESYIWSVLLSDDNIHEFIGDDTKEIKSELVEFCKENDLTIVSLLNVKHIRNSREMDQEYISDLEESLMEYELSWIEKTRQGNVVNRTRGFKDYESMDSFKSSLSKNPKLVQIVGYVDPSGNGYLEEDRSDKSNYLIDKSRSGRYELYRDSKTGNLKVYDTHIHKYVNSDISVPEDFESWKDD